MSLQFRNETSSRMKLSPLISWSWMTLIPSPFWIGLPDLWRGSGDLLDGLLEGDIYVEISFEATWRLLPLAELFQNS